MSESALHQQDTHHRKDHSAARSSALERVEVSIIVLDEVGAKCSKVCRDARCEADAEMMHLKEASDTVGCGRMDVHMKVSVASDTEL